MKSAEQGSYMPAGDRRRTGEPDVERTIPASGYANASPYDMVELAAWLMLCLFVFCMPWEKGILVSGIGSIARVAGILAFATGAIAVARRRKLRQPNLILLAGGIFVAWSAFSWLWSIDPGATVARVATLAQLLAMMWLIWELCRGPRRQAQLMSAYVLGAVVGAGVTFFRYSMSMQTYYRRYAATGFDPNDFGLILAVAIPFALYLAYRHGGWWQWAWYASGLFVIAALLLTASRTALICTFVGFLFVPLMWRQLRNGQRLACGVLLGYLIVSLVGIAPSASRERLSTIPGEITQGSMNSRKTIWKSGARYWLQHPVLGAGAGAYPEAVRPELGVPSLKDARYVAHNTFLSVSVETGILGFALFTLFLGTVALSIWTMHGTERAFWAVMLLVWCTGVLTLTWEHYKVTWMLFALVGTEWAHNWWRRDNTTQSSEPA